MMDPFDERHQKKIVIVGCGAGGIGAARTLYEHGYKPIVLEAKNRTNGRVFPFKLLPNLALQSTTDAPRLTMTERLQITSDEELLANESITDQSHPWYGREVMIQLGANWLHGLEPNVNPMYAVAQKLGLQLFPTSSDDEPGDDVAIYDLYGVSGTCEASMTTGESISNVTSTSHDEKLGSQLSNELYLQLLERYDWVKEYYEKLMEPEVDEMSVLSVFTTAMNESEGIFGPMGDQERRAMYWLFDRVAIDMGAPLSTVSKCFYWEGDSLGEHGEATIVRGYSTIIDHLVKEYPLDIHLNKPVKHIETVSSVSSSQKATRIHLHDGTTMDADYCIVTAPLGVIQKGHLTFSPSPPSMVTALSNEGVQLGLMNVIWLWFPHKFWSEQYKFFGVAREIPSGESVDCAEFSTFLSPLVLDNHGEPAAILMAQVIGPFAKEVEHLTPLETANRAMSVLKRMFGSDIPFPIGCQSSAWYSDNYTTGCWAHFEFNGEPRNNVPFIPNAAERVVYAGEAVNEGCRGTVHGAYFTGITAANAIIEHIGTN